MRRRSGAIHSETEEGFLQLASASENKTGIFYDTHVNRKVMSLISNLHLSLYHQTGSRLAENSFLSGKGRNCFQGFDFGLEFEADKQEREELERMNVHPLTQVNIGVISSRPRETMAQLCLILEVDVFQNSQTRGVDLIIGVRNETIFKYWVFNRKNLQQQEKDVLLDLYLRHCSIVIDVGEANGAVTVLKTDLQAGRTLEIKQNMRANLSY